MPETLERKKLVFALRQAAAHPGCTIRAGAWTVEVEYVEHRFGVKKLYYAKRDGAPHRIGGWETMRWAADVILRNDREAA